MLGLKYVRTTFYVDAVLVTAENLDEAAKWCGGEVSTTPAKFRQKGREQFIQVNVSNPLAGNPFAERLSMAFVGDYIVKGLFGPQGKEGVKVYTAKAFSGSFQNVTEEPCGLVEFTIDHAPCVLARGHFYIKNPIGCRSFQDYRVL